ncbi:MAG TPA: diguanylate cyclase [Thermoanaerobaculia bacterium]|nr:diguanylate cyclase [Thermoanaerobaculia bacterium]
MKKPLRLLLVEDSDLDAAHLLLELRRGGFDPQVTRVESSEEFERELSSGQAWDAIISDYHLPRFSAPDALQIYRMSGSDAPFIVVSGAIGEETAVELMRDGAHDYLLKHRLTRLAASVEQHVQQARERADRRSAEDLFRAVLRASPMPGVVVDRATAFVIDGSDSFRRNFLDGNASGGRGLFDLVEFSHPERIEQLLARGSGTAWYAVYYFNDAARIANVRCHSVDHEGGAYAYLVLEDVTEQHYLKAAFDAVPDPVLILSSEQTLLYANRAAEELFGDLYFGMAAAAVLRQEGLEDGWWRALGRFDERRVEFSDQPYDAGAVPFRFAGEAETSTILTLHNVSDEEELRRLATHDALTGVYNTRHFQSVLDQQLRGAAGFSPPEQDGGLKPAAPPVGTIALLDIDHFKPINDELGHAAGDAALMMFANVIRSELRPSDVFARLGGDEFAVFFPATASKTAAEVIRAIYARLARTPFHDRSLTASAGIAVARESDTPETLRRRADEALYDAKRQGRNRWVVATLLPETPAPHPA